ncbi:MAG: Na/Pi cotransporter family protein [Planctomycetes bacterium]|nr:Na/Pi cotransporter family protein [Planctomycetota bacterium]
MPPGFDYNNSSMDAFTFGDAARAVGGLALFLLGVRQAADGLKGLAGGRLRIVLSIVTSRRLPALFAGTASTFLLQSSTASAVMLAGLCDVGLLSLRQAAGVALGGCLGSTLTVQLIAFDISTFALLGVAAGLALAALAKHRVGRSFAGVLIGFGLIFYGMPLIREGLEPLRNYPALENVLIRLGTNPGYFVLAVLVAALFTVITQSSTATLAVAFGLARDGLITVPGALTFIFGAHLATFVAPLIATSGPARQGKQMVLFVFGARAAGVVVFAPLAVYITRLAQAIAGHDAARAVAWQHTIFNVANVLLVLPFLGIATAAVQKLLPLRERLPEGAIKYIDPKFPDPPSIAIEKARKEIHRMGLRVADNLLEAVAAVEANDADALRKVADADDVTDVAYEIVSDYLAGFGGEPSAESRAGTDLLHMLKDIEYAGDIISKDIVSLGLKKEAMGRDLSIEGGGLLRDYARKVKQNFVDALGLVLEPEAEPAAAIMKNEADLNARRWTMHEKHLEQVRRGVADAHETSAIYTDMLAALQHVTRCAAEIAETVLHRHGTASASKGAKAQTRRRPS